MYKVELKSKSLINKNLFSMPMHVYSKKIIQFIEEIKQVLYFILSQEVGLRVTRNRFYDEKRKYSYPLKIVLFNNKALLGYFDSDFYELGFNERLMQVSKEQLYNIARHEIAHYLAFITYGPSIQSHGPEFRRVCEKYGWGEGIFRASFCEETAQNNPLLEKNPIFRKIQKLLALGASPNKHEAEVAIIKSQQLLLKYNIDLKDMVEDSEKVFLKRILKQHKTSAKVRSIANILETFFVTCVFNKTESATYLEIVGDAVNIEIAEYVATVLDQEFEKLWLQAKYESYLKGTVAKNSFFMGLAKGYCNKISALKKAHTKNEEQALMVIEKKLSDAKAIVYPRLSFSKSHRNHCSKSSEIGEKMGKELQINPSITKSSNKNNLLLTH